MSNTVMCRKYKKELPALLNPPLPGAAGEKLMATVSMQAWREWITHQTMLINENRLSLMNASAREFLMEELEKFMDNEADKPQGFTEVGTNQEVEYKEV